MLQADYSSALTLLLRYPSPAQPFGPSTLVQDAIYLDRNKSMQAGAELIGRYTGRRPNFAFDQVDSARQSPRPTTRQHTHRSNLSNASQEHLNRYSQRSPARFQQYQKGLENAFQEVSGSLQKRAEGWSISKTVRGAVGEIRRNVNQIQSEARSPRRGNDVFREPLTGESALPDDLEGLSQRIRYLEDRNKALARMLGEALKELRRPQTAESSAGNNGIESTLNIALAKMRFVQVYLEDSEIPVPPPVPAMPMLKTLPNETNSTEDDKGGETPKLPIPDPKVKIQQDDSPTTTKESTSSELVENEVAPSSLPTSPPRSTRLNPRPSLAQSSFSWMLGENHHRSSFVSSASVPPEQRRESDTKTRPKQLFADGKKDGKKESKKDSKKDGKKEEGRRGSDSSEEDGFTLSSLRGRPSDQ